MTFAPCESSFAAQARAIAGLLPCVSHVAIRSRRPLTPPFALTCLTRICAAASAGPSNGAMAPFPSNAQPITIDCSAAAGADAAVIAATAVSVASTAASAPVFLLVITPPGALDWWTPIPVHDSSFALTRRYSAVCSGTGTPCRSASRTSEPVMRSISVALCASTSSSIDG